MPRENPILVFGCALGTGNLGVDALATSVVVSLTGNLGPNAIAIAGFHRGVETRCIAGGRIPTVSFGLQPSRRLYRPESALRVRIELLLPCQLSQTARILRSGSHFLDISGGDSFTDLYGPERFSSICFPKSIARQLGKPLILLPQTYGPFQSTQHRQRASELLMYARQAWARDARSYTLLRELLGSNFDTSRHRLGVDVAFLLPSTSPDRLLQHLPRTFAGINVSGLIWNDPTVARHRYGFTADYRLALTKIVSSVARDMPVVLIPHVLTPLGHYESDRNACEELYRMLPQEVLPDVHISLDALDPCEAKGLIASCQWFLGTRMHSTIAALSSGVPACAIAYSDKTQGVFESCALGSHVHDPRRLQTDELVERVLGSFHKRLEAAKLLATALPRVKDLAQSQSAAIATAVCPLGAT